MTENLIFSKLGIVSINGNRSVPHISADFDFFVVTDPTIKVLIDIKPGSSANCLNINGHGVIPVAILGSEEFDVTQVDEVSLLFAGLEVRVRGNKGPLCSTEYSNDDIYMDLVCHFEDDTYNWTPGDAEATLTGTLFDGTPIEGSDFICIVPKKNKKK